MAKGATVSIFPWSVTFRAAQNRFEKEEVSGLLAVRNSGMASLATEGRMGFMTEAGVGEPPLGNIGRLNLGQAAQVFNLCGRLRGDEMALNALLLFADSVEDPFDFIDPRPDRVFERFLITIDIPKASILFRLGLLGVRIEIP